MTFRSKKHLWWFIAVYSVIACALTAAAYYFAPHHEPGATRARKAAATHTTASPATCQGINVAAAMELTRDGKLTHWAPAVYEFDRTRGWVMVANHDRYRAGAKRGHDGFNRPTQRLTVSTTAPSVHWKYAIDEGFGGSFGLTPNVWSMDRRQAYIDAWIRTSSMKYGTHLAWIVGWDGAKSSCLPFNKNMQPGTDHDTVAAGTILGSLPQPRHS